MRGMQQQLGNLGTISAFACRHRETKKNLCRGGRSQDLPDTDFQPAVRHLKAVRHMLKGQKQVKTYIYSFICKELFFSFRTVIKLRQRITFVAVQPDRNISLSSPSEQKLSALEMETVGTCVILAYCYHATGLNISHDSNLCRHCCENLELHVVTPLDIPTPLIISLS